jgi:REP element-mobilizing transposase RayT
MDAIEFQRKERAMVLAFCVMPEHMHLFLAPRQPFTLPQVMQSIKGYSSRLINLDRGSSGPLWQPRYYDRIIRGERQLRETIDYIEQNPMKEGLSEDPPSYPYSSAGRPHLTDLVEYLGG